MTKAIHNADYDAVRLLRHYRIHTSPIHDRTHMEDAVHGVRLEGLV